MKKIISYLLAVTAIGNLLLLDILPKNIYAKSEPLREEKIYSTATVEEDFADNRVYMEIEL